MVDTTYLSIHIGLHLTQPCLQPGSLLLVPVPHQLLLPPVLARNLPLQLPLLFLEELARIFNFTFFVLNLDFN